jgi:putative exosortase-associated protein (TIGR04073 family)
LKTASKGNGMKLSATVSLITLLCLTATAEERSIADRMVNKAFRGAVDLVTGFVELPMQTAKGFKNGLDVIQNKPLSRTAGTVVGFFRGIGHGAGRVTHGGRELFCFWTADQASNEGIGIPFDAERSWEMGEQYSLFEPSLKQGAKPIGRKLVLGAANAFAGIAEVPVQIMKANEDGTSVAVGAGKGVYYFVSREIYGITDVFTLFFLVPNQETTFGYPYTTLLPWGGELPRMPES